MKKLILMLLAPSLAMAQGITTSPPGGSSAKVLLSLPFSAPGCYASGSSGVTSTRSTTGTYIDANGAIQTCAIDEYRVSPSGLSVEPARTNYAIQSGSWTSGASAVSPWTLATATATTVAGAPGGATWAQVTNTDATGRIYQTASTGASKTFCQSGWVAKGTGSGVVTFAFGNTGNASTVCTCATSDGRSCTASIVSDWCQVQVTATTTPVRVAACSTATSAATSWTMRFYPSDRVATGQTARFALAQMEIGTSWTSYFPTTTTSLTRGADSATITAPAGTTAWSYRLNGTFTSAAASPGTLTFVEGNTTNVRVCTAKNAKECK